MPDVIDDTRTPVAYEQIATATSTGPTTATHTTAGARVAIMQAIGFDVNWRDDGTAPVAGAAGGNLLAAGDSFLYVGDLTKIKFINTSAASGAVVNINSYK